MNIIFLGTPEFALHSLNALNQKHHILCVVTRSDALGNRNKVTSPHVKVAADNLCLPCIQTDNVNLIVDQLAALKPDVLITCAFGQLLKEEIINLAKFGVLNIHASLLPKYRGASPISQALRCGQTKSGVTIMRTVKKLDAGDILLAKEEDILPSDNLTSLSEKLSVLGAQAIIEGLELIEKGQAVYTPQKEQEASFCSKITQQSCKINWNESARDISNQIRSLSLEPCAFAVLQDKRVKIVEAYPVSDEIAAQMCDNDSLLGNGEVTRADKGGIFVKCGCGLLSLVTMQFPGGKQLGFRDIVNGRKIIAGQVFE